MKLTHRVLIVLAAAITSACASGGAKTEPPETAPAAKIAPAKAAPAKVAPAKAAPVKEIAKESPKPEAGSEAEAAEKAAPGRKFAKLKIGMTLKQVEKLIGRPARQWQHPTGKASIPFYFGPDRWVIQYSYKGEGVLTFNSGGEQLLTQIEVNAAE